MKKLFIILFVVFFSVFSFSCSDGNTEVDGDETADNETTDNETTDNSDQTVDDVQETTDDNQTAEDNENSTDDNQTIPDNEVNDTTEIQDDVVNDNEITDKSHEDKDFPEDDADIELTDDDIKPVEVECPEGLVGLSIKTFYTNGTENVDGGGTVTKNPAGTSTEDTELSCYSPDAIVSLTVVPETGFDFSQWKGKDAALLTGTFPNFSITLGTERITLRAEFAPQ